MSTDRQPGHLFIADGDLTRLTCDALLVPVDEQLFATGAWTTVLGVDEAGPLEHEHFKGRRVMPYAGQSVGPAIWLGDFGRDGADESWYADGLLAFVLAAAASFEAYPVDRIPRVAVNVAGSGFGGLGHDKGRLFGTIVTVLDAAARSEAVDVVLVCWGPKDFAAAQRARIALGLQSPLARLRPELEQTARQLADRARAGELVLFLGAGVSMGAGLPSWQVLLNDLLGDVGDDGVDRERFRRLDVRDQAQLIAQRFETAEQYESALHERLAGGSRYSLTHALLAGLGTREAVTTNYDTLYEIAASTAGRSCAVLPYEPVSRGGRWLLKLHGSVDRAGDLVLTRSDYLGLPERAGALFGLLQAMLLTRHMLFVGYSLTDDSFHKVMHEVRRARGPHGASSATGTALVLEKDVLLEELWRDDLDVVAMSEEGSAGVDSVRILELLLDHVGALAADVSAFLLDPSYRSLLDDEEREIARALENTYSLARSSSGPIASQVERVFARFGADDRDSAARGATGRGDVG